MSDKKTPKEPPSLFEGMSGKDVYFFFMSACVTGTTGAMIANAWAQNPDSNFSREREKIEQVVALEQKLLMIEGDSMMLDFYLKSAKAGDLDTAGCSIVDLLQEVSEDDQKAAHQQREKLATIHYLTVSDEISYRHMTDKAYAEVRVKVGQLKDICQTLFPTRLVTQEDDNSAVNILAENPPREWWDKPEISFNNDK